MEIHLVDLKHQIDMINKSLEQDLRTWCKTGDNTLFEKSIYGPLTNLAKSIIIKRFNKCEDYDERVTDMVSECSVKLPLKFNENKGTAKVLSYVIMDQFILNQIESNKKQKRSIINKTIYIEDIENGVDGITHLIEIEVDLTEYQKKTLMEKKELFDRLDNETHRKISKVILDAIENPNNYKKVNNSFTSDIAEKCLVSVLVVRNTINQMRKLVQELNLQEY